MELQDIYKQFGRDVTFEAVSPVSLNENIEVLEVSDRITDTDLLRAMRLECISLEALRQWAIQVKIRVDGKEFNIPAYPIGGWHGVGSLLDYNLRTATSSTLIRFRKWRKNSNLHVIHNYITFLSLWSQDLLTVSKGDFLILNHDTEEYLAYMAEQLRNKYSYVTYWLPSGLDNARQFTTNHTKEYGIIDKLPSLYGAWALPHLWKSYVRQTHQMPKWACCARCSLFKVCAPRRSRWHDPCRRYKPIDLDGEPTDGGKRHIFI